MCERNNTRRYLWSDRRSAATNSPCISPWYLHLPHTHLHANMASTGFTYAQVVNLLPESCTGWTESQTLFLSDACYGFSSTQTPFLTLSAISGFTPSCIGELHDEFFATISSSQLSFLSVSSTGALVYSQIAQIPANSSTGWTSDQLANLTSACYGFTSEQVLACRKRQ